jgi:tellurite resistance protein TerA
VVSLDKVTLTQAAPAVSLTKSGSAGGVLRVNLNWNARPAGAKKGGFLSRLAGPPSIDLDLGCLFDYADGSKGVVQALGNAFRDRHSFGADPICWLDGDDRSGANAAGENLFVRLDDVQRINRIMVFAYIYQGAADWAGADGVVTLFPVSGPQVEVRLDATGGNAGMCGIAMLERSGADLVVRREVRYVSGHDTLDQAYGWGLRWTPGRK